MPQTKTLALLASAGAAASAASAAAWLAPDEDDGRKRGSIVGAQASIGSSTSASTITSSRAVAGGVPATLLRGCALSAAPLGLLSNSAASRSSSHSTAAGHGVAWMVLLHAGWVCRAERAQLRVRGARLPLSSSCSSRASSRTSRTRWRASQRQRRGGSDDWARQGLARSSTGSHTLWLGAQQSRWAECTASVGSAASQRQLADAGLHADLPAHAGAATWPPQRTR